MNNRVGDAPDPSGQTKGSKFWGSNFVTGPQGELITQAATDQAQTFVSAVDLTRSENVRRWWPFLRDRRVDAFGGLNSRFNDD